MNPLLRAARKPFRYQYFNAVYYLIGINVIIFLVNIIFNMIPGMQGVFTYLFGLSYYGVTHLYGVWQFFTYMFLHDTSQIFHLGFNMFALYMFGVPLEKRLGSREFLLFYLLSGTIAGIGHFLMGFGVSFLADSAAVKVLSITPLIGASGAIFALLLAYGIYFAEDTILLFMVIPVKARTAILIFAGIEFFSLLTASGSNVSNLTHIMGLITAWFYIWIRKNINPAKVLFKKSRYR